MRISQHTPGPWGIKNGGRKLVGDPNTKDGQHNAYIAETCSEAKDAPWTDICRLQSAIHVEGGIGLEEQEANARLISAAPEQHQELQTAALLLKSILEYHKAEGTKAPFEQEIYDQIKSANAAIAKAEAT